MNPTRARLLDILMQMGLRISVTQIEEAHGDQPVLCKSKGGKLKGATIAASDTAALIDEIPRAGCDCALHGTGNRSAGCERTARESVALDPDDLRPFEERDVEVHRLLGDPVEHEMCT